MLLLLFVRVCEDFVRTSRPATFFQLIFKCAQEVLDQRSIKIKSDDLEFFGVWQLQLDGKSPNELHEANENERKMNREPGDVLRARFNNYAILDKCHIMDKAEFTTDDPVAVVLGLETHFLETCFVAVQKFFPSAERFSVPRLSEVIHLPRRPHFVFVAASKAGGRMVIRTEVQSDYTNMMNVDTHQLILIAESSQPVDSGLAGDDLSELLKQHSDLVALAEKDCFWMLALGQPLTAEQIEVLFRLDTDHPIGFSKKLKKHPDIGECLRGYGATKMDDLRHLMLVFSPESAQKYRDLGLMTTFPAMPVSLRRRDRLSTRRKKHQAERQPVALQDALHFCLTRYKWGRHLVLLAENCAPPPLGTESFDRPSMYHFRPAFAAPKTDRPAAIIYEGEPPNWADRSLLVRRDDFTFRHLKLGGKLIFKRPGPVEAITLVFKNRQPDLTLPVADQVVLLRLSWMHAVTLVRVCYRVHHNAVTLDIRPPPWKDQKADADVEWQPLWT